MIKKTTSKKSLNNQIEGSMKVAVQTVHVPSLGTRPRVGCACVVLWPGCTWHTTSKNRRTASERATPESIQFTCSYVYVVVLVALVALVMEEGQVSSGRTYLEEVG